MSVTTLPSEHLPATLPVPGRRVEQAASACRGGRLLRAVETVHASDDHVLARAVDGAVFAAALSAMGASGAQAAMITVLAVVATSAAGTHAHRNPLEVRGVAWYPGLVVAPLAVVALVVALAVPGGVGNGLVAGVAAGCATLIGLRVLTWATLYVARHTGRGLRPTLVVARSEMARMVTDRLEQFPEAGLRAVAVAHPAEAAAGLHDVVAGSTVEHLIVVPEGNDDPVLQVCLEHLGDARIDVSVLPPVADLLLRPRTTTHVGGVPLLPVGRVSLSRGARRVKRAFDVVVTAVLLVVSLPVMAAVALAVRLEDGGPVLYRQQRVGRNGTTFRMLKFRSMVVGADRHVIDLRDRNATDGLLFKVPDDPRTTRVGRVIRRLSIDELPQLWNVLRGEMSLVGPRPLAVDPNAFGSVDGLRHNVLPGITGYWQVAGGNGLTYQEMVKLDLAYIKDWSLWLDVRLLAATVPAVAHRRGPA